MSKQKEYIIEGMSCASCAMTIENAVSKIPGVHKASVNLATEIMAVEANDSVTPEDIAKVVDGVGYGARPRGKCRGFYPPDDLKVLQQYDLRSE